MAWRKCGMLWGRSSLFIIAASAAALIFTVAAAGSARQQDEVKISQASLEALWRDSLVLMERSNLHGNLPFRSCFTQAARRHGLPLPLLLAVARGESNFDPKAVSPKNCVGIMQIKWPETAMDLGITQKEALFDPCINIEAGARYLAGLIRFFQGNLYLALGAYNYGPGAIRPGRVPDGAHWYASYIHSHLQQLLASSPATMGQSAIRTFKSFHEAALFVDYLNGCVSGLNLRISAAASSVFKVYFTYQSAAERKDIIIRITRKTGIKPTDRGFS